MPAAMVLAKCLSSKLRLFLPLVLGSMALPLFLDLRHPSSELSGQMGVLKSVEGCQDYICFERTMERRKLRVREECAKTTKRHAKLSRIVQSI